MRERSLSDFWRITQSDDRVKELTSVLQGADSMIGVMGSGVRAVWSTNGQSQTWWTRVKNGTVDTRVFLDYSPLASLKPPFGGQAVDEVIGYAAHEGGHVLWSSPDSKDYAVKFLTSRGYLPPSRGRTEQVIVEEVLRVDNIIEDAFIDYHVGDKWAVLGEYIRWARQKIAERRPIDLAEIAKQRNPDRNFMMNLWIACTLYDEPIPSKMSKKVKEALNFLIEQSVKGIQEIDAYKRMSITMDCWEALQKFPSTGQDLPRKPQKQQPTGQPDESKGQKSESGEQGEGQEGQENESKGQSGETEDGGQSATGKPESGDPQEDDGDDSGGQSVDEPDDSVDEDGDSVDGTGEDVDEPDENDLNDEESGQSDTGDDSEPVDENDDADDGLVHDPDSDTDGDSDDTGDNDDSGDSDDTGDNDDSGDGEPSPQGGNEEGAPGNLDDFDIRDLEEVPESVLRAVLDAISHELEDISESVAEVLSVPIGNVNAQTQRADYDGPAADEVRAKIQKEIAEMRRVFDKQKSVQSRCIKGMPSGKIDGRSLAKVGCGNLKVFKRRQVLGKPDLGVGLVLDVSGSMNSYMGVVWMTAGVFAEALMRKPGVNFMALTYTGGGWDNGGICQTTRICDREMGRLHLGNVVQGGGTPTGEAIASAKTLMDRMPERKKVIIHFTDGDPDSKRSVIKAVASCRAAGYHVFSIAPRGYEAKLQEQYGTGNWETIASITELPQKVLNLVKELG